MLHSQNKSNLVYPSAEPGARSRMSLKTDRCLLSRDGERRVTCSSGTVLGEWASITQESWEKVEE